MRTLEVELGERGYPIWIGEGALTKAGELLAGVLSVGRFVIITNPVVWSTHGIALARSLSGVGLQFEVIEVPEGEEQKSLARLEAVYDELSTLGVERGDGLIAFGGGVIGDLTGFVAATYLRGLPFVQIPTTLLAQVDSSVGGKVGINLSGYKNLVGAFHQPRAVVADTAVLRTLPAREYACGLAEVIKSALLAGGGLLETLERGIDAVAAQDPAQLEEIIAGCCRFKAEVVQRDEREEEGWRRILNFGHTLGHVIEAVQEGRWRHGEAVAMGMVYALALGRRRGLTQDELPARLTALLSASSLPSSLPALEADAILEALRRDKKRTGGKVAFVSLRKPGSPVIVEVEDQELVSAWSAMRESDES